MKNGNRSALCQKQQDKREERNAEPDAWRAARPAKHGGPDGELRAQYAALGERLPEEYGALHARPPAGFGAQLAG